MKTSQQQSMQSHRIAMAMAMALPSSSSVVPGSLSLSSWSQQARNNINNHITDNEHSCSSSSSNYGSTASSNGCYVSEGTRNFNNHENIKNNFRTREQARVKEVKQQQLIDFNININSNNEDDGEDGTLSSNMEKETEQIVTPLIAAFIMKNDKNNDKNEVHVHAKLMNTMEQEQKQDGEQEQQLSVSIHPHDVVVDWGNSFQVDNTRNELYRALIMKNPALHNDNHNDQQEVLLPSSSQTSRCNNNNNKRIVVRDADSDYNDDGSCDNEDDPSPFPRPLKKRCIRRQLPTRKTKKFTKTHPPQETMDIVSGNRNRKQTDTKKTTTKFVSVSNTYPQEILDIVNNQQTSTENVTHYLHVGVENTNISISRGLKEGCNSKTTIGSMDMNMNMKMEPEQESSSSIEQQHDDKYIKDPTNKKHQKKQVNRKGKTYYSFQERLLQLADYKQKNGDCNVPKLYKGHGNLGHFVGDQRYQYKRYKGNKKSPMTVERITALEELNFEWTLVMSFDERLSQLALYKEQHSINNDCNVPFRYKGYKNLPPMENKPRSITLQQIMALEGLNFEWRLDRTYKEQSPPRTLSSFAPQQKKKKENINSDNNNKIVQAAVAAEEDGSGGPGWRDGCGEYYDSDDDCLVF
ncbi:hypothetical protein FRACYDRAFT_236589 [Fragilariopsis cylindrus CCMP1102]|uniref:Helicase-associated domain-containing protein n=1 Tax=Fragilariopsis cylindrus CCMP1102 TaxID=635003 RepID=A0A1E7FJF3_9STRA|nr:hypothetical protein FRACYDRAFT_236589 [Fragilariopsis cylindrus CCMP1102]|eukprot:OEU18312.1 hypothetical protein FRACYDRAFT_236589 [Fragilariopsis cylindrus CCMP1102]